MLNHCATNTVNKKESVTMKTEILTNHAPQPIGPYSQGVQTGETIYISGQLPIDVATGIMPETIKEQAICSLNNIQHILKEANADMNSIVKTTIFMTDLADFTIVNDVYATYFEAPFPSRSTIQVAALPRGAQIEIEAVAVIK